VASLDDALVNLELRPVHDALRLQLDPAWCACFADLAEHPRTLAGGKDKRSSRERTKFFELAWARCENLPAPGAEGLSALARTGHGRRPPIRPARWPGLPRASARRHAHSRIEALFPAPWTAAARRMLPSPSPQLTATAMWGPVLGWCVLELLAESIDAENPERVALDLFDRLRLREPFAQAFAALGFEGEEGWRVAAPHQGCAAHRRVKPASAKPPLNPLPNPKLNPFLTLSL
jgi:hypothetical protein